MTDLANMAEAIAQRCQQARPNRNGFQAICPAHDDDVPSLSITSTSDRVLIHCHAGCEPDAIMQALGLTLADLFVPSSARSNGHKRIVARYPYLDGNGHVLHVCTRFLETSDPLACELWQRFYPSATLLWHLSLCAEPASPQTILRLAELVQPKALLAVTERLSPPGRGTCRRKDVIMLEEVILVRTSKDGDWLSTDFLRSTTGTLPDRKESS